MSLTFPLSVDDFAGTFRVRDRDISLTENTEMAETNGGDLLLAETGPRLWRGHYELSKLPYRDYEAVKALVEELQVGARAFHAFDHVQPGPKYDPDGKVSKDLNATLAGVDYTSQRLKIGGLPEGFQLARGDRFTFVTNFGAVAYHRVSAELLVANGLGETPWFPITPQVLPGAEIGNPVTLWRPYFKARIIPKSFKPGRPAKLDVEGMRFDFIQQVKP